MENFVSIPAVEISDSKKNYLSLGYGKEVTGEWLKNALPLDAAIIKGSTEITGIVEKLFPDIIDVIIKKSSIKTVGSIKSPSRIKYTCKTIVFNLYFAYLMDKPLQYSRSRNSYSRSKRYGKLFFKFSRIMPILDALVALGLINQKMGIHDKKDKRNSRQSRIWASEKLISLFWEATSGQYHQVFFEDRKEILELRDIEKKPVNYAETQQTRLLRENLRIYNDFIDKQRVEVISDGTRTITFHNLRTEIFQSILRGNATLTNLKVKSSGSHNDSSTVFKSNLKYHEKDSSKRIQVLNTVSITNTFSYNSSIFSNIASKEVHEVDDWFFTRTVPAIPAYKFQGSECGLSLPYHVSLLQKGSPRIHGRVASRLTLLAEIIKRKLLVLGNDPQVINEKFNLQRFEIDELDFEIISKKLYRVFNKNSFNLGGRFYGSFHQTMPKEFRRGIMINGEKSVELDFAAHHVRIPYHLEKIDYREDPYLALTDEKNEREIFKKLLLIAINAETEVKAIRGFRNACIQGAQKDFGPLTNANIKKMMDRVHNEHNRIARYLNSGAGLRLQNIDSKITEAILTSMTGQGIPCLPVHDSYIVPQQFEGHLKKAMMEEYERILGFSPVIA